MLITAKREEKEKWARRDLNPRPIDYESTALTTELRAQLLLKGAKVNSLLFTIQEMIKYLSSPLSLCGVN